MKLLALIASLAMAASVQAAPAYKAPRLSDGHPDLQGDWNNDSITTLERPAQYGERKALTPAEAGDVEGEFTDLAPEEGPPPGQTFSLGGNGDLSAFTHVMRVGGEPRTA